MNSNDKEALAIRYLFESSPETAWDNRAIITTLGLRGKQIKRMNDLLFQMVRDGNIVPTRKGTAYMLAKEADLVTGALRMVRNGAGHVIERRPARRSGLKRRILGQLSMAIS